jgi:signal transduction histidine kinase
LRGRLVAASLLATAIFSVAFAAFATWRADSLEDRALTSALQVRLSVVREGVGPDGHLAPSGSGNPRAAYAQVIGPDGKVIDASSSLQRVPALISASTVLQEDGHPTAHGLNLSDPDIDLAVMGAPVRLGDGTGVVVVGVETQGFLSARREVIVLVVVGLIGTTLLVGAITWLLTGRALKVVGRLTTQAERLSARDASRGLTSPPHDKELAQLTDALNRMLARLNEHYARNLAAAAETTHRLRTPLATLRAEAELALGETDPEQLRLALAAVVADADRLSTIVNRLLAAGSTGLPSERLDVVVAELQETWQRSARAGGLGLEIRVQGDGWVDPHLLRAVVEPLLENAVEHATPGSLISVLIEAGDQLTATVDNDGRGVPADLVPHLFEPWASGTPGRSGLGLWLARETAREAGGDVTCGLPGPGRTRFVALLPTIAANDHVGARA